MEWEEVGYILASDLRLEVLKYLKKQNTIPSNLARQLGRSRSTVSTLLKGLAERDLVECLDPERRKGRIYAITDKGEEVLGSAQSILSGR